MNLSSHPSLLHPPTASSGRHWWREAAEETHLPLLPAQPQECFSSGPLAPCVDALSAGCVLHVKQAADAVRKKKSDQEGQGGTGTQGGPTAMPPAWPRFAATPTPPPPPLRSSPPTNTSHYFTPSTVPPGSTCHPSINPIPS
ncbi:hypothetical protein NQZ68_027296 [Dissostichus eleginoides]|nr:hypothetical protein NQZ68_027296 [Dissostichus eleginoides]